MKSCTVEVDDAVRSICNMFDFAFDGTSTFDVPSVNPPDCEWRIGLIVGPSGSGKSSALARFGQAERMEWNPSKAIVSHFDSAEDAHIRLSAAGLNSVTSWVKPFHVLSTGEQFRADMARRLRVGAVIDEFTSVVDRNVAKSASVAIRRFVDRQDIRRVVFASCHYDIIEWLQPDWIYDTSDRRMTVGRSERRPEIVIDVVPCLASDWSAFSAHHYLTASLNPSARCWIAKWDGVVVGFSSALPFPNGHFRSAWREHRTVVLPDFQGLGIGPRLSDALARLFVLDGCRFFSKTAHPRLGAYRDASPLWRGTSRNGHTRDDYKNTTTKTKEDGHKMKHAHRACFSHEFIENRYAL